MSGLAGGPSRSPSIVAVTSGKGGVGKTNVVVNLAVSLARLRHRVAILDADFGLGNVDVLLGLAPPWHIGHLLAGERTLDEIMVSGPLGVRIIPASSGLRELAALTPAHRERLSRALETLRGRFDFLLIDTAAGISDNVIEIAREAGLVLVVTSLEPTAMVDAYAMLKILTTVEPGREVGLVVNGARDAREADLVFTQLDIATTRFLRRRLLYYGHVPLDAAVRQAVLLQRAVVDHEPQAAASRCFRLLASRLTALGPPGGGLRLVQRPAPLPDPPEVPQCA